MRYIVLLIMLMVGTEVFSQNEPTMTESKMIELPKSTPYIDSIKLKLLSADESEIPYLQFVLFGQYLSISLDSSEYYIDKSMQSAFKLGDSLGIANALHGKGGILFSKGNINESIDVLKKALGISTRNGYDRRKKFILNYLALAYTEISNYNEALRCHFESLKIREIEGNPGEIAVTLTNIGFVHHQMHNYNEALEYYKRAYEIKMRNKISYNLVKVIVNIASVFNDKGEFVMSRREINKALKVCDSIRCREVELIEAYQVLGSALFNLERPDSASFFLKKSIDLSKNYHLTKHGDIFVQTVCLDYQWLAKIEIKNRQFNKALEYLDLSQSIARRAGLQMQLAENYELYSKIFYSKKNFKRSVDSLILFQKINSEILNTEVIQKMSKAQSDFDNRIREAKMKDQEAILGLQEQTIRQQGTLNLLTGAVAILILGIAVFLIRMVIRKQKINELLDLRVRERTHALKLSRDEFRHANEEKIFVLESVHRGLQSSLATLKGLGLIEKNEQPEEKGRYFAELESVTEKMAAHVRQYIPQTQGKA